MTPGLGVDVHGVAMLSESVDESADAGGAWKDGAPLFEGEIGGDNRGPSFVAPAHDVVEEVGGSTVAREIAEFVENQDVGSGVAFEPSFDGGQRFLPEKVCQHGGECREADSFALFDGMQRDILGEHGFSDAALAAEEDVFATSHEVEPEQKLIESAVDGAGMIPIERVERANRSESCCSSATSEVSGITFTCFQSHELFDDLGRAEAALGGVNEPGSECVARSADADPPQGFDDVFSHHSLRDRAG